MTPEQIEAERAAFEAWAKIEADKIGYAFKQWQFIRTDSGDYSVGWTASLWDGWMHRAELSHAERREMQETEQRLRAEIARLQAIASQAVPSEAPPPLLETMQIWDIFQRGKWWAAMVSPIGWDAFRVKQELESQGYSSDLVVAARKAIAADANPVAALMARNAELEALLAAAPQP